jgi:hypothetical protein
MASAEASILSRLLSPAAGRRACGVNQIKVPYTPGFSQEIEPRHAVKCPELALWQARANSRFLQAKSKSILRSSSAAATSRPSSSSPLEGALHFCEFTIVGTLRIIAGGPGGLRIRTNDLALAPPRHPSWEVCVRPGGAVRDFGRECSRGLRGDAIGRRDRGESWRQLLGLLCSTLLLSSICKSASIALSQFCWSRVRPIRCFN